MYCHQCEQTAKGVACTVQGVCGKDETTAVLQDALLYATEGISMYAQRAAQLGARDRDVDVFVIEALFTTVTNVNFDADRLIDLIGKAMKMRARTRELYEGACAAAGKTPETPGGPAGWTAPIDADSILKDASVFSINSLYERHGEAIASLMEIIIYGLKGAAAYADHAQILGQESEEVYERFHEALNILGEASSSVEELLGTAMGIGELNLKAMELLDRANTGAYGHPEPTRVRVTPVKGKAILISGHDLKDLEELLRQTEGKGINVYTHGEMLPAHGYPGLKKYPHLVGNYGGAWQDQAKEFDAFPGSILMTTNCIQKPRETYRARIFTTGLVAWPGVVHVPDRNFEKVIEAAETAAGFTQDAPEQFITVGFGHNAVLGVADTVISAVKEGKIRHFFLVGGCDGAKSGRNYYTEFAESVPDDCVVLTLACGKYRFNKLEFGEVAGIPRLLDVGQCNDAYSAVQIATALANAFGCGVNDLPLSFVLSWYEQKAVAILLTLLHLGIKNIRLGPTLPAFVSSPVLNVLVEKFNIAPTTDVRKDMEAFLGTTS